MAGAADLHPVALPISTGGNMKFALFRQRMFRKELFRNAPAVFATVLLLAAILATPSFAQYGGAPAQGQSPSDNKDAKGAQGSAPPQQAPKLNPKEEKDYKELNATPDTSADKKIQLGTQFLQKYPTSRYEESVMNQLVTAYYAKQDWNNFYSMADKAVAKDPDDVDVLTVVGWVIPHLYNHDDPDAIKKLDKAEAYEKHAIDVIPTLSKPDNLSDEQFAKAKSDKLAEAHSALGLIYFRVSRFPESVKELQLATTDNSMPDATDLYALGAGLMQLNRNSEAADAFAKCGDIAGGLQDRCKQMAAQAKGAK
jgi:tetratricopeptide (TPR) repeat protein